MLILAETSTDYCI